MLNVACMQKIKIGHRAKFRDKDKCFLQLLFPVRAILRCISTSGVLRALLLTEILTNFADAYILVMAWMGYARVRLKTLSSLLKISGKIEGENAMEECLRVFHTHSRIFLWRSEVIELCVVLFN